ncbi:hypothetical protein Tco_0074506, partial [Tanacetum coccineum]
SLKIVMDNPNSPNEPNKDIPEENLVIPELNHIKDAYDPNEMVDIPDDEELVDYDGDNKEEPEKYLRKNPKKNRNQIMGMGISLPNILTHSPII